MEKAQLDPKDIAKETANVLLNEGIDFYVEYENLNWLRRKRILPDKRHFYIKPIVAGTLIRITKLMVDMEFTEKVDSDSFLKTGVELMTKDIEPLIEIVALAITNKEQKPGKKLIRFLRQNVNMTELLALISYTVRQMNVSSFMSSIMSIKGMSLINP